MKSQRIAKVITVHPEGGMNVCAKRDGISISSSVDISIKGPVCRIQWHPAETWRRALYRCTY